MKYSSTGYTNVFASFAWHKLVVGVVCLSFCPVLLIHILVFYSRFTVIPLITTQCLSLPKSLVSIAFSVPFHFTAIQL